MWFRLMMIAFALNGVCTFGLRILADRSLAQRYTALYLVFWYLSGAFFMLLVFSRKPRQLSRSDTLVGVGLGTFSAFGQNSLGLALATGMPGSVVYPVVLAGGLFVVVAVAITVFKERIGLLGITGILLGIVSVALLSVA